MNEPDQKQRSEADAALEREVRESRKFTLEEAIGRMAGPGAMKGESLVTRQQQAELVVESWIRSHVPGSELQVVLQRDLKSSELLLQHVDQPQVALETHLRRVLDSHGLLKELVRSADAEWGRTMGERPHFEKEGEPPHPEDPYTAESVRNALAEALRRSAAVDAALGADGAPGRADSS